VIGEVRVVDDVPVAFAEVVLEEAAMRSWRRATSTGAA
jgi:hypothetical protein